MGKRLAVINKCGLWPHETILAGLYVRSVLTESLECLQHSNSLSLRAFYSISLELKAVPWKLANLDIMNYDQHIHPLSTCTLKQLSKSVKNVRYQTGGNVIDCGTVVGARLTALRFQEKKKHLMSFSSVCKTWCRFLQQQLLLNTTPFTQVWDF